MMVDQLRKSEVFKFQDGRCHLHFKKFSSNPCKAINESVDGWTHKKVGYVLIKLTLLIMAAFST